MSNDNRRDVTNVRLTDPTHERLKAHCREGETLSGAVGRALDALEREQSLPEGVRDDLPAADWRDRQRTSKFIELREPVKERLDGHVCEQERLSDCVDRALNALERRDAVDRLAREA